MLRKVVLICLLFKIIYCQEIDFNICPNGLTTAPSDSRWPKILPHRFEIFGEITTNIETLEITQLFIGPYQDAIYFRDSQTNLQTYYDFQINEMLTINEELICAHSEIGSNEYLPFIASQIVKPSILLGFNGRNNYSQTFYTRFIEKQIIRGGILTDKFQSCFFIDQQNLTINATYYLSESPSKEIDRNIAPDIVQIDVHSNNYPYTYNIIRYISNPSITITTPSSVFCRNRINKKEFPQNLPSHLFLHAESYTPKNEKIDSYNHLIDEALEFERIDFSTNPLLTSNRLLIDHSNNLSYIYTYETQQCIVMNATTHSMGTINEILFEFGTRNDSILFQYTGLNKCEREYVECHRWIGQYDSDKLVQQYEWYWTAKYNEIDLKELIPIKVSLKTILKTQPQTIINQEINIFNYNPSPNSIESIDSTFGECYRALESNHYFNYAVLRITLNNDDKYPIHRYLLSLENDLHIQLADDLKIRHIRLSSFVIDITNQQDKDIYITFTLLDNPFISLNSFNEPTLIQLIQQLNKQINDRKFNVRINDGGFDLQARPNSLRILVFYLLPLENYTNYFNETVFVYHNVTQTIIKQSEQFIYKHIGSKIVALWTSFALLGLVIAIAIGSFQAIRKWKPTIHKHRA